jgi:hypothetical protein
MSSVAAPPQPLDVGGKGEGAAAEAVAAASDVAVAVEEGDDKAGLKEWRIFAAMQLPMHWSKFFAIVCLGCLASAITSGACSAAGSDSGFAIAIVLAAPQVRQSQPQTPNPQPPTLPQYLSMLTTSALMPPLLLRIMCLFHLASLFFAFISVASFGVRGTAPTLHFTTAFLY